MTYSIDLKVYEPASMYEVPFPVPEAMRDTNGHLKVGYHNMNLACQEDRFENLLEWGNRNGSILKIIGWQRLG